MEENKNNKNNFLIKEIMNLIERLSALKTSVEVTFQNFSKILDEISVDLKNVTNDFTNTKITVESYKTRLDALEKSVENFAKEIKEIKNSLNSYIKKPKTKTAILISIGFLLVTAIIAVLIIKGILNIKDLAKFIFNIYKEN